ncbi:flagellin, partial [Vibrio alfacsensis]
AELKFDLASRDGIKQSIAKVNQHLQQAQVSLNEARQFQSQLNTQMTRIQSQSNVPSSEQVAQKLNDFTQLSQDFTTTFKALNAQA